MKDPAIKSLPMVPCYESSRVGLFVCTNDKPVGGDFCYRANEHLSTLLKLKISLATELIDNHRIYPILLTCVSEKRLFITPLCNILSLSFYLMYIYIYYVSRDSKVYKIVVNTVVSDANMLLIWRKTNLAISF